MQSDQPSTPEKRRSPVLRERRSMSSQPPLPNRWHRADSRRCRCGRAARLQDREILQPGPDEEQSLLSAQVEYRAQLPAILSDIAVAIPRLGLGMRPHVLSFLQARGLGHL